MSGRMPYVVSKEVDRIRRYAQLALNGFETLETEDAIGIAQANLRDLLSCLGRAEDAVPVLLVKTIKGQEIDTPVG